MRDQETVEIGLRGALTGHLVLSTLHTNDAVSSAIRLLDMGAPGYLAASALRGVVAQRLVRKICDSCESVYTPTPEEVFWLKHVDESLGEVVFKKGRGCQKCNQTGYKGRIGVFELLELNDAMMDALKVGDTVGFAHHARESNRYRPLAYAALTYAKMGMTTVEEVLKLSEMVADTSDTDVDKAEDTGDGQV